MRSFALLTLLAGLITITFFCVWMIEGEPPDVEVRPQYSASRHDFEPPRVPTIPVQSTAPQGIQSTLSSNSPFQQDVLAENTRVFRGIVVDSRGLPVPGAHVRFQLAAEVIAEAEAQVDGGYGALVDDSEVYRAPRMPGSAELREIEKHLSDAEKRQLRQHMRMLRRELRERSHREGMRRIDRGPYKVVARCDFDGFISDVQTIEVRSLDDGVTDVDFVLLPGSMVKGEVRHEGFNVRSAQVYLLDLEFNKLDETTTNAAGVYEFGIGEVGSFHIVARREGTGSGMLENQTLSPLWGIDLTELLLEGAGYLKGHVSYPNGTPAANVNVIAIPEEFAYRPRPEVPESERLRIEAVGGLAYSMVSTDKDGAFQFSGLAAMDFGLRFVPDPRPTAPMVSIHPPRETGIELVLEAHRLCVVTESWVGFGMPGVTPRTFRIEHEDDDVRTFEQTPSSVASPPQETYYFVEPGEEYVVRAEAEGMIPAQKTLTIAASNYETRVNLGLLARDVDADESTTKSPTGRIRVEIRGAKHAELPFRITLNQDERNVTGFDGRLLPESHELRGVPLGDHLLTLTPDAVFGHYTLPTTTKERVAVLDGRLTNVAIKPETGGRIAITILPGASVASDSEDRESLQAQAPLTVLVTREGADHPLLFRHLEAAPGTMPAADAPADEGHARLTPGSGYWLSDVLPKGVYHVTLGGEGYEAQKHTVTVPEGKMGKLTASPIRR